jgi:hypothetical protein
MEIFNVISEILAPKSKLSRLFFLTIMLLVLSVATITLVFSELKKQDISKSQLEIEKNRVSQIDKQLSNLYDKAYQEGDSISISKGYDKTYFLKQIEFLKTQRNEAVKSIDEINKTPDTQVLVFTALAGLLTIFILIFFSSSFKSSISISARDNIERFTQEQRKRLFKGNHDFLQWVTTNELAQDNLTNIGIEKAKKLKELYDLSEGLGEQRNKLLNLIISYTNVKRSHDEVQNDKHSDIFLVFEDMQTRLKDECNRLNKHAIINLFLCFFIAFVLMSFIAYTSVFSTEINNSNTFQIFIIKFLPRIVAIISLLTMFLYFAKLYKTNIIDVKYYQNELTNIEIKQASLQTALINEDKDLINKVTYDMSTVDRNKVITKDQTTSEIERLKLENEVNKDYLNKVWELLTLTKNKDKE